MANNSIFELADKFGHTSPFTKDIGSPFGGNSIFNRQREAEEQVQRAAKRAAEKSNLQKKMPPQIPKDVVNGKNGRVRFDAPQVTDLYGIAVNIYICFYGYGFQDLFVRCIDNNLTYNNRHDPREPIVRSKEIRDWLVVQSKQLQDKLKADNVFTQFQQLKTEKQKYDFLHTQYDKLEQKFYQDLVDKQCIYFHTVLNRDGYSHKAEGPDKEIYDVSFYIEGQYIIDETDVKSLMVENSGKNLNNTLFFVRMELFDGAPHNSQMKGIKTGKPTSGDNSMIISSLHLLSTHFTHELIAHPFWGRGDNGGAHLPPNWNLHKEKYGTTPSIRLTDYDPYKEGLDSNRGIIVGLPDNLKIKVPDYGIVNRLDQDKRKVLSSDIPFVSMENNTNIEANKLIWQKASDGRYYAWIGDATNTFFAYDKNGQSDTPFLEQQQYTDKGNSAKPTTSKVDGSKMIKLLSLIFLIFTSIFAGACNPCTCRKAEEVTYAKYRQCILSSSDSICSFRAENGLTFDCAHRYTRAYIAKQLGKPFRIYIRDKEIPHNSPPTYYEDWLYPSYLEKSPNQRSWIGSLLVIRFELKKDKMMRFKKSPCPGKDCHQYFDTSAQDDDGDWVNFINSDSFDIKYPYILRNEGGFWYWY
jgi:hypothetical protein